MRRSSHAASGDRDRTAIRERGSRSCRALGPATGNAERAEFDVVLLPNGETRMYVGVGGGGLFARFRRNENVRSAPAATVLASWIEPDELGA